MINSKSTIYFTIFLAIILVLVSPVVSASDKTYLCSPLMLFNPNIQKVGFDAVKGEPIFEDVTDYKCKVTWYCDETYTATESLSLCKTIDKKSEFTKPPVKSVSETGFVTYTMSVKTFFACDGDSSKYYGPYVKENFEFNIDCRALKKALDDAKEEVKKSCKEDEPEENDACDAYRNEMDAAEQALSNAQNELTSLESELIELKNQLERKKEELAPLKSTYETHENNIELKKKICDDELEKLETYKDAHTAEAVNIMTNAAGTILLMPYSYVKAIPSIIRSIYEGNLVPALGLIPGVGAGIKIYAARVNLEEAEIKIRTAESDWDAAFSDLNLAVELFKDWIASPQGIRMTQLETEISIARSEIYLKQDEIYDELKNIADLKEIYESKKAAYEKCLEGEEAKAAEMKKAKEAEKEIEKAACDAAKAKEKAASDKYLECISGK